MSESTEFFGYIKDGISKGISKGIRIVNIRSREAYDTIIMKNKIKSLNKKKKGSIVDIGNSVYRMHKHKGEIDVESVKTKCNDITTIEDNTSGLEEELRLVHENAQKELGRLKAITKPKDD